jgi:hypothetical protein
MGAPNKLTATRVRLLFAALILWQPFQYFITAKYGEPYPALILPPFSGTMQDQDGNIRFRNVNCKVTFQDGGVGWTSAYALLAQAPSSQHGAIMNHMFGPPDPEAHESGSSLKARLFPGRAISHLRQSQKKLDPQTEEWLQRRMQELYPSRTVTAVAFVWYDDTFRITGSASGITENEVAIRDVQFK